MQRSTTGTRESAQPATATEKPIPGARALRRVAQNGDRHFGPAAPDIEVTTHALYDPVLQAQPMEFAR